MGGDEVLQSEALFLRYWWCWLLMKKPPTKILFNIFI